MKIDSPKGYREAILRARKTQRKLQLPIKVANANAIDAGFIKAGIPAEDQLDFWSRAADVIENTAERRSRATSEWRFANLARRVQELKEKGNGESLSAKEVNVFARFAEAMQKIKK